MPGSTTLDVLDAISACGDSSNQSATVAPASSMEVTLALKKVFITGGLRRIPKNPRHREIVLAVLCLGMLRRYPYTEFELNELLKAALESMQATVDHVTCRRYLVDLGFVKRDRAGARYLLNYPRQESTLSADGVLAAESFLDEFQRGRIS